jgi:hypothetical protein
MKTLTSSFNGGECCNPSLGLVIKARACKGASQKKSPWVTSHVLGNVGECEGMNPHTPKWAPILGVGFSMDSRWTPKFSESNCRGQHPLDWGIPYIIGIFLEHRCLK